MMRVGQFNGCSKQRPDFKQRPDLANFLWRTLLQDRIQGGTLGARARCTALIIDQVLGRDAHMLKITLAVMPAATVLTTTPLIIPANAEGVRMAQGVDVQIGRDRDRDPDYRYDRARRAVTIGCAPRTFTLRPREPSRTLTTTI